MMQDETIKKINFKKNSKKKGLDLIGKKFKKDEIVKKKKTILKTTQIKQIVIKKTRTKYDR